MSHLLFCVIFVDFHPSSRHTHVSVLPLCHRSDSVYVLHEKIDSTAEEQRSNTEDEGDVLAEKRKDHNFVSQQQEIFLSSARSLFQGNVSSPGLAGSNLSAAINRKRIFSLEPFHQSSIVSGRQKREREKERDEERQEEEEKMETPAKKAKFTNSEMFSQLKHCPLVPLWSFSPHLGCLTSAIGANVTQLSDFTAC